MKISICAALSALLLAQCAVSAQENPAAGESVRSQILKHRAQRTGKHKKTAVAAAAAKPAAPEPAAAAENTPSASGDNTDKSAGKPAVKDKKGDDGDFYGVTVMDVQGPYEPPKPAKKTKKHAPPSEEVVEPPKEGDDEDMAPDAAATPSDEYNPAEAPVSKPAKRRGKPAKPSAPPADEQASAEAETPADNGDAENGQAVITPDGK